MSSKNKRDVGNKLKTKLSLNEKPRNKPTSAKHLHLKQDSKINMASGGENQCLNAVPINSDTCNQSTASNIVATGLGSECTNDINLASPRLCSALQLANEIKSAKTTKSSHVKLCAIKQEIKQKAVKKTNVPFSEHIFHNLVDLEINDEAILSGRKTLTKSHEFVQSKDKVFHLEDYYKPHFSTEFCPDVPFQKREIEKIQYYNGFEIYDRINDLSKC